MGKSKFLFILLALAAACAFSLAAGPAGLSWDI